VCDGKAQIEEIMNDFNKLFIDLNNARQKQALELSKKLQETQDKQASTSRDLQNANCELVNVRNEAAEQAKKLEEQEAELW
jgi:hypothetical protein